MTVELRLEDEAGRALYDRLLPRAIAGQWDGDPSWGQTGRLTFASPEALRDALIENTLFEFVGVRHPVVSGTVYG